MADDRDQFLQTLFAEVTHDLGGKEFTARVVAQTGRWKYQVVAIAAFITLILVTCAWFFTLPLQEFAFLITQALTITLVDMGDSWLAWLLAPVNNIASLIVISVKAIRVVRKKMLGVSYSN